VNDERSSMLNTGNKKMAYTNGPSMEPCTVPSTGLDKQVLQ
jgi:hypothetical protein